MKNVLIINDDGPRFQKHTVWKKSKKSFDILRGKSFEIMSEFLGSFHEKENPTYPKERKNLPCYQPHSHFYIESLNLTAVQGEGGYFLFRPLRCQLCKRHVSEGSSQPPTQIIHTIEPNSYGKRITRRLSEVVSEPALCTAEDGRTSLLVSDVESNKQPGIELLQRGESTELSRTTKQFVDPGMMGKKKKRPWKGPGTNLFRTVMGLLSPPRPSNMVVVPR